MDTGKAAFRIPAPDFLNLIQPEVESGGIFLGLQFFFKNASGNKESHIKIKQVFYKSSGFVSLEVSSGTINKLEGEQCFLINQIDTIELKAGGSAIPKLSHFQISSSSLESMSEYHFEKLDYYDEEKDLDFIFFTEDQIKFIVENAALTSGEIIISGAQLQLGKKLAHRGGTNKVVYEENYFTLKLEGLDGPDVTDADNNITEDPPASVANIAIGYPCPPDWYLFPHLFSELRRKVDIEDLEMSDVLKKYNSAFFNKNVAS